MLYLGGNSLPNYLMENQAPSAPSKPSQEGHGAFVCNPDCCKQMGMGTKPMMKIGNKWATALAGFVAGAAVAAIILVPWMIFQGKLCSTKQNIPSNAANVPAPEQPADEAAAPAPEAPLSAPDAAAPAPAPAP